MDKGTRLFSILNNKCPKCQEGDFFVSSHSYDFKNFSKMYPECPVCHETYEPEPGYYFGAMYVSYAINVAIMVAVWVAISILFSGGVGIWWMVLWSIVAGVALTPVTFRWARLIWINMFVKYDPDYIRKKSGINLPATSQ